jgi:hypothetical protein
MRQTQEVSMTPGLVLLAGAVAAKVVSIGWLASIATSPVAVGSRKRFLETNKQGLDNLIALGVASADGYASLKKDFELLESTAEKGWDTPELFAAASRVSSWKFIEHTYGAVTGTYRLSANTAVYGYTAVLSGISRGVDWIFRPAPTPDKDV